MKLPDGNVLLNAYNAASSDHEEADHWLEDALSSSESIGFAHTSLLAFLRIGTNPRLFPRPLEVSRALDHVDSWLATPAATIVEPGAGYIVRLRELLEAAGTAGDLTTNAHLAAIALERGASVVSFDADFHKFDGLDFEHLGA